MLQRRGIKAVISALENDEVNLLYITITQQQARAMATEPYGRLTQFGNVLTGLGGGVSGQQYAEAPQQSPFQTALSTALGIGGLYGKIFG